jgi:hypothetical protein
LGLVKTGGAKKGFITSQRRLGEKEIQMLKKAWSNLYSNKSENAIVLNEGMDFKEGSSTTVELQLNEREWTCECGVKIERDVNAAINILNQGLLLV